MVFCRGSVRLAFPTTLLEMQHMFPDENAAAAYLRAMRWPDGLVCRFCDWKDEPYVFENRTTVLRCRKCRHDTSITADTVMHATRTSLQVWFWAAYLVTTQTPGESALQFQRQLGLRRYETAFQILHKLRAAMVRPDRDRIGGKGRSRWTRRTWAARRGVRGAASTTRRSWPAPSRCGRRRRRAASGPCMPVGCRSV